MQSYTHINDNYNINEDLSNRKKKNINKNNYDENEDNETPYNKQDEDSGLVTKFIEKSEVFH